jgi:hypothetical protein
MCLLGIGSYAITIGSVLTASGDVETEIEWRPVAIGCHAIAI